MYSEDDTETNRSCNAISTLEKIHIEMTTQLSIEENRVNMTQPSIEEILHMDLI